MTHQEFQERIELMLYSELGPVEERETRAHVLECQECRSFHDELKKLHGVLAQYKPVEISDRLLYEAREQLQSSMKTQAGKRALLESIEEYILGILTPRYRLAFGGVATIAIGFFAGYLAFRSPQTLAPSLQVPVQTVSQSSDVVKEEGQITNVRFINSDTRNGEVEFTFDAVMPVHMKGSVTDPKIQQVLAHALLNEQNPGVRLRSVNAIASEPSFHPDNDIRDILITAVKSDANAGVRKEALKALQKFPMDQQIKKTLLDVLTHDDNSALRIAAINVLASAKAESSGPDQEFLDVLKQRMQSDKNDYIRVRAKAVLQENKQ